MTTRYTFHNKSHILNPAYFLIIQGCLSIHFLNVFFRVGFSYPFDINFPVSMDGRLLQTLDGVSGTG